MRKCEYCEEPLCEEYYIDLRELGLGCFHKDCVRKCSEIVDVAMDWFLDPYTKRSIELEAEDEYERMMEGV